MIFRQYFWIKRVYERYFDPHHVPEKQYSRDKQSALFLDYLIIITDSFFYRNVLIHVSQRKVSLCLQWNDRSEVRIAYSGEHHLIYNAS